MIVVSAFDKFLFKNSKVKDLPSYFQFPVILNADPLPVIDC